jgi:putative hydrolase of the HAD superfamily
MNRSGLILDFGGVLTTSVPACALAFDRSEGLVEGTFLRAISADPVGRSLYADLERGTISQGIWNEAMGTLLGVDGEDLLRRVLADLRPEPKMIAAAQAARNAGVRVGIFTNSLGLEPYDIYEGFDLDTAYDALLISEHHGARKPDPHLYPLMLDAMRLPGRECIFVDDTARNLEPFAKFGVTTVLATEPPEKTIAQVSSLLGLSLQQEV